MKTLDYVLGNETEVLNFLKSRYFVHHLSNIFFRDIQYGIQEMFERKGMKVPYAEAETLARAFVAKLEKEKIFKPIDRQSWVIQYPEFKTKPQAKAAAAAPPRPSSAAGPTDKAGARPVLPPLKSGVRPALPPLKSGAAPATPSPLPPLKSVAAPAVTPAELPPLKSTPAVPAPPAAGPPAEKAQPEQDARIAAPPVPKTPVATAAAAGGTKPKPVLPPIKSSKPVSK